MCTHKHTTMLKLCCASQQLYGSKDVEELTVNSWLQEAFLMFRVIPRAVVLLHLGIHGLSSHAIRQHDINSVTREKFSCPVDMFIALNCLCVSDIVAGQITSAVAQLYGCLNLNSYICVCFVCITRPGRPN